MVPFLHVCPDYRTSKRQECEHRTRHHPSSRRRQGGKAGASGSGDAWRVAADQNALLLPEPGFIMAESGQQTPASPLQTAETEAQHVRVLRNYRRP